MGGLGFRGVIEKENTLVGARNGAWSGHSLTAADNAGDRCRVFFGAEDSDLRDQCLHRSMDSFGTSGGWTQLSPAPGPRSKLL